VYESQNTTLYKFFFFCNTVDKCKQILQHTGCHDNIPDTYDSSPIGAFSSHKLCMNVYNASLNDTWNIENKIQHTTFLHINIPPAKHLSGHHIIIKNTSAVYTHMITYWKHMIDTVTLTFAQLTSKSIDTIN
jgi:hypothetical protein